MTTKSVDGFARKTLYKGIRPLALRCVPSDHERSRPLGAYFVLGTTA